MEKYKMTQNNTYSIETLINILDKAVDPEHDLPQEMPITAFNKLIIGETGKYHALTLKAVQKGMELVGAIQVRGNIVAIIATGDEFRYV
jgi:hypothetical protein